MHQQRIDSLSIDEISFLYRIPSEKVKEAIDAATAMLRSQALDVQQEHDDYLARKFRYLADARLCCVCESFIDEDPLPRNLVIESIRAHYCSKDCRDQKPPRIIELEVEKGLPIERILEWTFRRYRSLSLAEQALQMPRWLVYDSCRRYLGVPLEQYFPALQQLQNQRRSALIRRTWHTPRWVSMLTQRFRPVIEAASNQYGPPTLKLQGLREQLAHLLDNL
jgi:hypothetical protein